jgi:hypothetical protein
LVAALSWAAEPVLVEKVGLKVRSEDRHFGIVVRDVEDRRIRAGRNAQANVISVADAIEWQVIFREVRVVLALRLVSDLHLIWRHVISLNTVVREQRSKRTELGRKRTAKIAFDPLAIIRWVTVIRRHARAIVAFNQGLNFGSCHWYAR